MRKALNNSTTWRMDFSNWLITQLGVAGGSYLQVPNLPEIKGRDLWCSQDYSLPKMSLNYLAPSWTFRTHNVTTTIMKMHIALALCSFILGFRACSAATPTLITELIVLGDSLSDNGLLFKITNGTLPPENQYPSPTHSFSNGFVWHHQVELLNVKVTAYAVGGSRGTCCADRHPLKICSLLKYTSYLQDPRNLRALK